LNRETVVGARPVGLKNDKKKTKKGGIRGGGEKKKCTDIIAWGADEDHHQDGQG